MQWLGFKLSRSLWLSKHGGFKMASYFSRKSALCSLQTGWKGRGAFKMWHSCWLPIIDGVSQMEVGLADLTLSSNALWGWNSFQNQTASSYLVFGCVLEKAIELVTYYCLVQSMGSVVAQGHVGHLMLEQRRVFPVPHHSWSCYLNMGTPKHFVISHIVVFFYWIQSFAESQDVLCYFAQLVHPDIKFIIHQSLCS